VIPKPPELHPLPSLIVELTDYSVPKWPKDFPYNSVNPHRNTYFSLCYARRYRIVAPVTPEGIEYKSLSYHAIVVFEQDYPFELTSTLPVASSRSSYKVRLEAL
jgi:hypothetical protein